MKNTKKSYFNFLWKQHYNYGILVLIAQLLLGVVPTIFYLQSLRIYSDFDLGIEIDHPFMIFVAAVTMISAMVVPFISFGYLFKGSNLDTYFSLPVPKAYLYIKQTIFSYVLVLIPTILVTIINVVLIETSGIPTLSVDYELVIRQLLMILIASSIFIMPSILAILATGDLLNAIVHTLALHGSSFILYGIMDSLMWGHEGFTYLRAADNPRDNIPIFIPLVNFFNSLWVEATWKDITMNVVWGVLALIVVIKLLKLFKNYKLDNLNTAPQSKHFYRIVTYVAGILAFVFVFTSDWKQKLSISSYNGLGIDGYIIIFAVAFVVYFIVRLIQEKGFPKFKATILNYIVIVAVALGISLALMAGYRFVNNRIPRANSVDRVDLYIAVADGEAEPYFLENPEDIIVFTRSYYGEYRQAPYDIYSSEEQEDIEFITDLQSVLMQRDEFTYWDSNTKIIKIVYYKNDNIKMMREYIINTTQFDEVVEQFGEPIEVHRGDATTLPEPTHAR